CTSAAPDCGVVDFYTALPTTLSAVHWLTSMGDSLAGSGLDTCSIFGYGAPCTSSSAAFFGNPFAGSGRNTLRGQTVNQFNPSDYKTTKGGERVRLQIKARALNVTNRQFRGVPDPFIDDCPFNFGAAAVAFFGCPSDAGGNPTHGSFGNNFFNGSNR